MSKTIIHYSCEDGIKNLSLVITICHYSASLVMPNGDPRDEFSIQPSYILFCRTVGVSIILSLYLQSHKAPVPVWTPSVGFQIIWYPVHQVFSVKYVFCNIHVFERFHQTTSWVSHANANIMALTSLPISTV